MHIKITKIRQKKPKQTKNVRKEMNESKIQSEREAKHQQGMHSDRNSQEITKIMQKKVCKRDRKQPQIPTFDFFKRYNFL